MYFAIENPGFTVSRPRVTAPAVPLITHAGLAPRQGTVAGQVSRAFVFTDIVSSTELAEQLGDRRFAALVEHHNASIAKLAAEHGGHAAHFLGDGFLVVLPHARGALAFAAGVQLRIAELRERLGLPLRVRIGVNAGTAHVAGSSYVGRNVILARRLCEHARADEILVSSRLCDETRGFGSVRRRQFKGLRGLESACTLVWS